MGPHPMAEVVGFFAFEQGDCGHIVAHNGENVFDHNWNLFSFDYYKVGGSFSEVPFTFA